MHELDKISQLPDDILIKIVSTLDLEDAARTSILAKRWRYLWTWVEDLDFGDQNVSDSDYPWVTRGYIEPQGYINCVNQVINAHRGPCVCKFKFFFKFEWTNNTSDIEKWLRFALSKRVEELKLGIRDPPSFSLGFDILRHPLENGIPNLKSLHLSGVDVSGEALEFILTQCHLLEKLHVGASYSLHTLNIVSYKLKHLTLIRCTYLKELKIDAVNMVSFCFTHDNEYVHTHMVFKNVPKLVEVICDGHGCQYPFPLLEQVSTLIKQLTKLSFFPNIDIYQTSLDVLNQGFRTPLKLDVLFPSVKQLTLTSLYFKSVFVQLFMNACPMLQVLKLQAYDDSDLSLKEEAKELQEIKLEDERSNNMLMGQKPYAEFRKENVVQGEYENKQSYPHLKVLEVVGFHGCDTDVHFVLQLIACAKSFETFIWDPRRGCSSIDNFRIFEDIERIESIKRRACKFAKLLPPKVQVGVRGKSGISWVS